MKVSLEKRIVPRIVGSGGLGGASGSPTTGSAVDISITDPGGHYPGVDDVEGALGLVGAAVHGYQDHGAVGATETVDLAIGHHRLELDDDLTVTLTGAVAGDSYFALIDLEQDGTGGWDVTWPGTLDWVGGTPTIDPTAGTTTSVIVRSVDGGTSYVGYPVGGGGSGTPATTVTDETSWGITPAVGTDTEYARQDHTHGSPPEPTGGGQLLISSTPSTPLVFDDILQNSDGTDFVYASS